MNRRAASPSGHRPTATLHRPTVAPPSRSMFLCCGSSQDQKYWEAQEIKSPPVRSQSQTRTAVGKLEVPQAAAASSLQPDRRSPRLRSSNDLKGPNAAANGVAFASANNTKSMALSRGQVLVVRPNHLGGRSLSIVNGRDPDATQADDLQLVPVEEAKVPKWGTESEGNSSDSSKLAVVPKNIYGNSSPLNLASVPSPFASPGISPRALAPPVAVAAPPQAEVVVLKPSPAVAPVVVVLEEPDVSAPLATSRTVAVAEVEPPAATATTARSSPNKLMIPLPVEEVRKEKTSVGVFGQSQSPKKLLTPRNRPGAKVPMAKSSNVSGLITKDRDAMVDLLDEKQRRDIYFATAFLRQHAESDPLTVPDVPNREQAFFVWLVLFAAKLESTGSKQTVASACTHVGTHAQGEIPTAKAKSAAQKIAFLTRAIFRPTLQLIVVPNGKDASYNAQDIRDTARVMMGEKPPGLADRFPYLERVLLTYKWGQVQNFLGTNQSQYNALMKKLIDQFDFCVKTGTGYQKVVEEIEAALAG